MWLMMWRESGRKRDWVLTRVAGHVARDVGFQLFTAIDFTPVRGREASDRCLQVTNLVLLFYEKLLRRRKNQDLLAPSGCLTWGITTEFSSFIRRTFHGLNLPGFLPRLS
jgi:hypothetical protein